MRRRLASQTLDTSNATARVAPELLKALAILPDTTVIRSTINQKDLKASWKLGKRSYFSRRSTGLLFTRFSKTLLTTERRLTER